MNKSNYGLKLMVALALVLTAVSPVFAAELNSRGDPPPTLTADFAGRAATAPSGEDIILDGGFEEGSPNPYWDEYSTNYGTPLYPAMGGAPPLGYWIAWFGDTASASASYEEGYLRQDVTIPTGSRAILGFYLSLQLGCGTGGDYLEVNMDTDQIFYIDHTHGICGQPYWYWVEIDVSAYADGGVHTVEFYSEAWGDSTDFLVDVVVLDITYGCKEACYDTHCFQVCPAEQDGIACHDGSTIDYTFELFNEMGVNDSFDVVVGGNLWDTNAPATVAVDDGDSDFFAAQVTVPAYANDGDSDEAVLTITSQAYPTATLTVDLTSYAGNAWVPAPDGGSPAMWMGYASDGASFYYFDGLDDSGTPTDQGQVYDPGTGTWDTFDGPGFGAYGGVAGYDETGGLFYYAPGFDDPDYLNALDDFLSYDPGTDTWTALADRPQGLGLGAGGVTDDGKFVWVGGSPGPGFLSDSPVYVYDIASTTWMTPTQLTGVRFTAPGYVMIGDQLYVGGSYYGEHDFYLYDVGDDTWTQLADIPSGAGTVSPLLIYDGADIYLVGGGLSPGSATAATWRYDIAGDSWEQFFPLENATLGNGGGFVDGVMYTFGGGASALSGEAGAPHEYNIPLCPPKVTAVLEGHVYNGVSGDPIVGALVEAVGTGSFTLGQIPYSTTSGPGGYYSLELPAEAYYDVTGSYDDFDDVTEPDVSVPLAGTELDLYLGPPDAEWDPPDFDVTLEWAEKLTDNLDLENLGYSVLDYDVLEIPGGGPYLVLESQTEGSQLFLMVKEPFSGKHISVPSVEITEPAAPTADVDLILDDGSYEGGWAYDAAGTQFTWLNRFTPPGEAFSFYLEDIWVLFPDFPGWNFVGDPMTLVVLEDTDGDGDISNATLRAYQDVTILALDAWSMYTLDSPLLLNGPGDVIIGVIDRTALGYPAAIDNDTTSANGRAYFGWWATQAAPDPPEWPPSGYLMDWSAQDDGPWLVRGFGSFAKFGDIPWLSEDPTSGAVPAAGLSEIDVIFDAGMVDELGTYSGTLVLLTDDPDNEEIHIPVEMEVIQNLDAGLLNGTVTTDRPGGPKEGAEVFIEKADQAFSATLTTDASGFYSLMIHPDLVPDWYTVTVSAPGYFDDTQVLLVTAPENLHDVELILIGAEMVVEPTYFYNIVEWGKSITDVFSITNLSDNTALDFRIDMKRERLLYARFNDGLPEGWQVWDNAGEGLEWDSCSEYGMDNWTGGGGDCFGVDTEYQAGAVPFDTELWSPPIDLTGYTKVGLKYYANYQNYGGADYLDLDISTDGGLTWNNLSSWNEDHGGFMSLPGQTVTVNLDAYVGEEIILRWHYYDPYEYYEDWYVQVDEVIITAEPDIPDWLSWTPDEDTVGLESTMQVTVTKDSWFTPMPGVYNATLNVKTFDDPYNVEDYITIVLEATDVPDKGYIEGIVYGNRTLLGDDQPLPGATVRLYYEPGTADPLAALMLETTADEVGHYEFYVLPDYAKGPGEFTIEAEHPGYIPQAHKVEIGPGDLVEFDFTLLLFGPNLQVDPEAVSDTLAWGDDIAIDMTVGNPDPATGPLTAEMIKLAPSFTPPYAETVTIEIAGGQLRTEERGEYLTQDAMTRSTTDRTVQFEINKLALSPIKVGFFSWDAQICDPQGLAGLDLILDAYPDLEVGILPAQMPALEDLQQYDVIYVGQGWTYPSAWDAEAIGDVFADYVEAGGRVIMGMFSFDDGVELGPYWHLGGRFQTEFAPITYGHDRFRGDEHLSVYNPGHPIMDGWNPGTNFVIDHLYSLKDIALANGGEAVAFWNTGNYHIVANQYVAVFNQFLTCTADYEGDVPMLLHNAILFLVPQDVPWLTASETAFELPVGGSASTVVTLDSAPVDQPGTYNAWLWFDNNDPIQPGAYVPVEMKVLADPNMGRLEGTITLNRHGTGMGVAAPHATVMLSSTFGTAEFTANENGQYVYYFGPTGLPAEVEVSASFPQYLDGSALGTVNSGATTVVNIELALDAPWIQAAPSPLEIDVPLGDTGTLQLDIENLGVQDLAVYNLLEFEGGGPAAAQIEGAVVLEPAATGIDPALFAAFAEREDGKADFFIAFYNPANLAPAAALASKAEKGAFVVATMQAVANSTQANVKAWLDARGIAYKSFWINNTLFITADRDTLMELAKFPEVAGFAANNTYHTLPTDPTQPFPSDANGFCKLGLKRLNKVARLNAAEYLSNYLDRLAAPTVAEYPWNVVFPGADMVHMKLGITGEGVVVGGIDSGVEYDHPGLINNYRGNNGDGTFDHTYSWHDPTGYCGGEPCDTDGHGTSTHGIMNGDNDPTLPSGAWVGMAPDAQFVHCNGLPDGSGSDVDLIECFEFMMAPGGDPSMAPDLINNSWGSWEPDWCDEDDIYEPTFKALRAADIFIAFAAGNVGDWVDPLHCNSSTAPANEVDEDGDPLVFATGAHGPDGEIDSYSSGGPNACNPDQLFPDLASPGGGSCTTELNGAYSCGFGGTSAASPHTAGCVALIRSANPDLTVSEIEQLLRDTAVDVDDTSCGGTADWNNIYGEGWLNCYDAVLAVMPSLDIPWLTLDPISGTVSSLDSLAVEVVFDSDGLTFGTYTGTLQVLHNDPMAGKVEIPVIMHVIETYGVELLPETDSKIGEPDSQVGYELELTNTGNTTETFNLAAAGNTWAVTFSGTEFTLGAGDSTSLMVYVDIPSGAVTGDSDAVTITATSQTDVLVSASSVLTTEVLQTKWHLFLPLLPSDPIFSP
jgi:hypothetical protein